MTDRRAALVWADWAGMNEPQLMGQLHSISTRGSEVFSFEYDEGWLKSAHATVLDPSLQLLRGPQYLAEERDNFGVFLDSSPDRWGRVLMQRREAVLARKAGRAPKRLTELDYLLGVYDGHRMGALRFRIGDGPFLDDNVDFAAPPWASLRALEQASLKLEQDGADSDPDYEKWLRMLVAPGRSLGGARPKASVLDERGQLWIAKFPSADDSTNVGAWESVLHTLATNAGIRTAESRLERFGNKHHTFLSRRFDRTESNARRHFASAMTLLNRGDGEAGASYLHLAEVLIQFGAHTARDLEELWRRIVFFMCVSNVDDHLRNHGFLLGPGGWELSPAYDMNPVPTGGGLMLNVSELDNAQDLALAKEVAIHFRVKAARADAIIDDVVAAVSQWRAVASKVRLSREAQDRMAPAFGLAHR